MKIQDESGVAKPEASTLESQGDASEHSAMPGTNDGISCLGLLEVLGWDEV